MSKEYSYYTTIRWLTMSFDGWGDKHNVLELMGPICGAGSTFKGLAFAEVVP